MATSIEKEQDHHKDIWLDNAVIDFLKTHLYATNASAMEKDGVYRRAKGFRWLAHNLYKLQVGGIKMQMVPQPKDRVDLTTRVHRDMGHYGVQRVIDMLRKNCWWKGLGETVVQVVRQCLPCARTKAGFRLEGKELQPLPLQGLMYRWGIDFAGPLPETEKGNKYVLVCIEHCTKWIELIALPSKSSGNVARTFVDNILSRFGAPAEVLTDQGTEFQGEFHSLLSHHEITHRIASREHPQADGLAERMVQTLKQGLRRCLLDNTSNLEWDDVLPYVSMGYRMSKQKSTGYSPYFLLYGREPLFQARIQQLENDMIDPQNEGSQKLKLQLAYRGAILQDVMPLAMRNMAIAQQRDEDRFRLVRGGGYDRPKATFAVGDFVLLKQKKKNTLDPPVRPHVLRVIELRKSGVAILQGSDATTISHQVSKLAHCSVPVIDTNLYPETFVRTDKVHCQRCGTRKKAAIMLLCDVCNEGWHFTCLEVPLDKVPEFGWRCEKHKVHLLP